MTKSYGSRLPAVSSLDLHVSEHELLVLLGPSGCGKTTTLRLIAGLETPSAGTISIAGRIVNGVQPHRRNVAMMFQRPALYPNRTVLGNLRFSIDLQRRCSAASEKAIREVARTLGLDGLLDRYPGELAGGEQQRAALGRALVRQAAVLLLDEPLSNLDAPLRLQIRHDLHLLHRQIPATIILVTHDPAEAMALGDRLAILDGGTLRQLGQPIELWERPAHPRVAELLCPALGWLTGRLERRESRLTLVTAAGAWSMPESWTAHAGRAVQVGIRPEDVDVPSADAAAQPMRVMLSEPQAAGLFVTCTNAAGKVTGVTDRGRVFSPGDKIMVKVNWPSALLFDASTAALLASPVA